MLSELGTPYRQKIAAAGCPELLHQLQRFPLERVVEVTPDGRSATARLVRSACAADTPRPSFVCSPKAGLENLRAVSAEEGPR